MGKSASLGGADPDGLDTAQGRSHGTGTKHSEKKSEMDQHGNQHSRPAKPELLITSDTEDGAQLTTEVGKPK